MSDGKNESDEQMAVQLRPYKWNWIDPVGNVPRSTQTVDAEQLHEALGSVLSFDQWFQYWRGQLPQFAHTNDFFQIDDGRIFMSVEIAKVIVEQSEELEDES